MGDTTRLPRSVLELVARCYGTKSIPWIMDRTSKEQDVCSIGLPGNVDDNRSRSGRPEVVAGGKT